MNAVTDVKTMGSQRPMGFENVLEPARETVAMGEKCVRRNPESAIWTTFAFGLLLGGLLGFVIADQRRSDLPGNLRRFGGRMQKRFGF